MSGIKYSVNFFVLYLKVFQKDFEKQDGYPERGGGEVCII